MPINRRLDKQIVVYSYNTTLLSNKKEQTTDMCKNMDEPQKQYFEQRKAA